MQLETPNEKQKKKTPIATSHRSDAPANKRAGALIPGFRRTLAALCALVLGSGLFANVAAAQQVQGGFQLPIEFFNAVQTVTFTAIQNADGTVTGRAYNLQRIDNTITFRSELRIDCMHFLDENTVILAGVTVRDTDPEFVGNTFFLIVRDYGEGPIADASTNIFYSSLLGFEVDCDLVASVFESGAVDLEPLLIPIRKGEVQVQP